MPKDIIEERNQRINKLSYDLWLVVQDNDKEKTSKSNQVWNLLEQFEKQTAQIVAREVLRKVREGVPEEVKHTLPSTHINFKIAELGDRRHNNCRKEILTHLQSLEDELPAEVLSK
jgi:hypothetical protein